MKQRSDFHSSLEWSQNWLVLLEILEETHLYNDPIIYTTVYIIYIPDIWRSEVNIPLQSIAHVESMNHRPVPWHQWGRTPRPEVSIRKRATRMTAVFGALDLPKVDKLVKTVGMKCVNMHIDNII